MAAKAKAVKLIPGEGPYCAWCHNAMAEYRKDPQRFDIHVHATKCKQRFLKRRKSA